jgi:hypothetical protein
MYLPGKSLRWFIVVHCAAKLRLLFRSTITHFQRIVTSFSCLAVTSSENPCQIAQTRTCSPTARHKHLRPGSHHVRLHADHADLRRQERIRFLLVIQFCVSRIFIISTSIIYLQDSHTLNFNYGFDTDNVVNISCSRPPTTTA